MDSEQYRTRMERRENKKPLFSFRDRVIILSLTIILSVSGLAYTTIFFGGIFVVDKEAFVLDATTEVVTEDGDIIGQLYLENRELISIDKIPDHVLDAYVSVEDRRFYKHSGVDYYSIFRAVYRDIIARSKVEGGSTITQQLAKNLFFTNDKTWLRKIKEIMAAFYIERHYTKDEIFEMYLNQIYFGSGVYGIETATERFFSKSVDELTLEEGALLAGLAKAPNGYSPIDHPDKAIERRNIVLKTMEVAGKISPESRADATEKPIELNVEEKKETPWVDSYLDLVMKEAAEKHNLTADSLQRGGYRIVANIDEEAQKVAYERFQNGDYFPGNNKGTEGAFVMKEPKTGKIKVAIGGRDFQFGELNRINVKRQPGSTFKPLAVYAPALMSDDYTPYSLLPDREIESETYGIKNADQSYDNIISLYNALAKSKNTSAVWLLDQIGVDYSKEYLKKLGLNIPDDGLSIGLGGLENGVSPLDMADAYSVFANNGQLIESASIHEIYDRKNKLVNESELSEQDVFSPEVAWEITEILSYAAKYGTGRSGEYSGAIAGKTGTTQHPLVEGENKDAWFVGYTPDMVTAMWMGYDVSDSEHYLVGGSDYPTRMTKDILTDLSSIVTLGESFTKPEGAVATETPIDMPVVKDLTSDVTLGGPSLMHGKLSWTGSDDSRVIYRIYKKKAGIDERVGEVQGETTFEITGPSLFQSNSYYVVPYDPFIKIEGKRSETIELSF